MGKVICITGNRPHKLHFGFDESHPDCMALKKSLAEEIEKAVVAGYTKILSGMALGVDLWAVEAALELKEKYPQIIVEAIIPCENQSSSWNQDQKERYFYLLERCDRKILIQRRYSKGCMIRRNKYMVEMSRMVIAVWNGEKGGTEQTINFAKKLDKKLVIISAKQKTDR